MNNDYMRQLESMIEEMAISVGIKCIGIQVSRCPYLVYADAIECRFLYHQMHVVCTYVCTGHLESDAKSILCSCFLKVVKYYEDAIQSLQVVRSTSGGMDSREVVRK